jgi:hypothetical protein
VRKTQERKDMVPDEKKAREKDLVDRNKFRIRIQNMRPGHRKKCREKTFRIKI